jgi:soluble lytic murein transglycosylase-like protein
VRNRILLAFVCAATLSPGRSSAGTLWSRERPGGVVEFTNRPPKDPTKWKVLAKTGPGKAAALRGSTDLVPARDTSPARFSRYDRDIRDQQAFYGIPEALIHAVIKTESDYDPGVVSSAGAQGLMQLMPDTARLMGVTDPFDPRQSIMGGARYLQLLARRFCKQATSAGTVCAPDEKVKIIAAYHAGPGAVEKYGGIPPYETTHFYVAAVMRRYDELGGRAAPGQAP